MGYIKQPVERERVRYAAPEVLEENGKPHTNIRLHFKADRVAVVA
jgi:hypothetical protein